MIQLVIYGLLAAGAVFAGHELWSNFKDGIGEPYAAAQRQADQKELDGSNAIAKQAVDDLAEARKAAAVQNEQLAALKNQSEAVQAQVHEALERARLANASQAAQLALLRAKAAAAPAPKACPEELADVDKTLTDSAKRLRGIP